MIEISYEPSKHIFETDKDKKKEAAAMEELKFNESVALTSNADNESFALTTVEEDEETKEPTGDKKDAKQDDSESITRLDIKQVNISLINKQVEVMNIVFDHWVHVISTK